MTNHARHEHRRVFFFMWHDWTWWAWLVTAAAITVGLLGPRVGFLAAVGVTVLQLVIVLMQTRQVTAFAVQLRAAYLALLLVCLLPRMRWLFWLPAVGTFALVIFGYCLMARVLSLLPHNRREKLSADLLARTFLSRPSPKRLEHLPPGPGCARGLCTIEAQVAPGQQARASISD